MIIFTQIFYEKSIEKRFDVRRTRFDSTNGSSFKPTFHPVFGLSQSTNGSVCKSTKIKKEFVYGVVVRIVGIVAGISSECLKHLLLV